jgi:hypothetical protein
VQAGSKRRDSGLPVPAEAVGSGAPPKEEWGAVARCRAAVDEGPGTPIF